MEATPTKAAYAWEDHSETCLRLKQADVMIRSANSSRMYLCGCSTSFDAKQRKDNDGQMLFLLSTNLCTCATQLCFEL
jgi:hypothetical protein